MERQPIKFNQSSQSASQSSCRWSCIGEACLLPQKFLFQDISEEPRIRFGIKDPSISSFKIIGFTFSAYHALKAKYRSGQFCNASDDMTSAQSRMNWSIFAEVLAAEAGEARVFHRAFSIPKFISFLCSGRHPANSMTDQT